MGQVLSNEDKVINALAIRNTSNHTSTVAEEKGYIPKTIIVHNGLNQTVSVQLQGSIDDTFNNPLTVGNAFNVSASEDDYATLTDYLPYLRVVASCSIAPTTGTLTVYLAKVGG
jgi:hypothetical protein